VKRPAHFTVSLAGVVRNARSGLLVFALSTAAGLYFAAEAHLADPSPVRKGWLGALVVNFAYYWAWGAAVPIVAFLCRHFPIGSDRRLWNLGAHAAAAVLLTAGAIAITVLVICPAPTFGMVGARIATNFYSGFLTYWLILFVLLTLERHRRSQGRELQAARLERQLAEARLQALRSQLNPHFLFNALNSVSSLVYDDAETADIMIQKLGELLRLSLDRARGPEIRLSEELTFVQSYLDIERLRFAERLQVKVDIEAETLLALVPAFALQPLVENAVHHSIAPRRGGHVEITARREQGCLVLAVIDDGPGIAPGSAERVGLANTRARLEQLYGRADALRFVALEDGRLRVEIVLPFRVDQGASTPLRESAVIGRSDSTL
jgi:two-component system, LytTR family, sensor kinase